MSLFTVDEVPQIMKCKATTVRQWIREAKLKATKFTKAYRINGKDLRDFMGERLLFGSHGRPESPAKPS